jgi:hypothetical protein
MKNVKFFSFSLILISGVVIGAFFIDVVIGSYINLSFAKMQPPSSFSSSQIQMSKLNYGVPIQNFNKLKIGFVKPIFTDAAYNNRFYIFYGKYAFLPSGVNITLDHYLLNSKVSELLNENMPNLSSLSHPSKVINELPNSSPPKLINDIDVDKGKIFDNRYGLNLNLYDILILGHQEYVTQKEYDNLKQFVSNGGTLIILDSNVFYAEVKYFDNNNTISLVKGHGWAYNGNTAWKSIGERWKNETEQWVGSNYLCYRCVKEFKNNPFNYSSHEEQYITNSKDIILLNYNPILLSYMPKSNVAIATYELNYGKGKVISLGIYSDDIIHNANFIKFFSNLLVSRFL